jgi:cyclopropane-fatty-acyl-phospholipid synthase
MSTITQSRIGDAVQISLQFLDENFGRSAAGKTIGVRLWDGTRWPDEQPRPVTLVLNHPGALRAMFLPGHELGLAEAYLFNDFDIEGDIIQVFSLADMLSAATSGWTKKVKAVQALFKLPEAPKHDTARRPTNRFSGVRHSIQRDRQVVSYHYDVSNNFYQLFLDRRMVYSCAYFATPQTDLDSAQTAKLDYICRKLRLRRGQKLLDIGCGWGGLVMYAAQNYGVEATGITLSQPQADLACERIADAGLSDRCRIEVCDYREFGEPQSYDALVSVGMFEHVGQAKLPVYFKQAYNLVKPGGVFLNHGIASRATDKPSNSPSFTFTYVFPDGELVPINVTLHMAEESGFEVRDMESLREHYALTLRNWVSRLESMHTKALRYVDEFTYRIWRLYMSGSVHGFNVGFNNIYQTLLVRPGEGGSSGLPLTRSDWYR